MIQLSPFIFSIKRMKQSHPQQPNSQEMQNLKSEIARLKQLLQETGSRGDNELEQWRKVVEAEKNRADQAEKAATELHKRVQVR
jgi:vacuolar-type H+-ATPase subunit I/STV1